MMKVVTHENIATQLCVVEKTFKLGRTTQL